MSFEEIEKAGQCEHNIMDMETRDEKVVISCKHCSKIWAFSECVPLRLYLTKEAKP